MAAWVDPAQAVVAPSPLGSLVLAGRVVDEASAVPLPSRCIGSWVLSVVHRGQGHYHDEAGRRAALRAGSVLVIPPRLRHWYGSAPGSTWTETWAVFAGPLFDLLTARREQVVVYSVSERSPVLAAIPLVLERATLDDLAREHQLLDLLGLLIDVQTRPADGVPEAIRTAAALLAEDLAASLPIPTVAEQVGMGYETFRRAFRLHMGATPAAFRDRRRMDVAAKLLRVTDLKHRSIADRLGFTDEFHFSRRFKAAYGTAPRHYRAAAR